MQYFFFKFMQNYESSRYRRFSKQVMPEKNAKKSLKKQQLLKNLPDEKKKTLKKGRENTHFAKIPAAAIFRSQKRLKKGRENQNSDPNLCVQKS